MIKLATFPLPADSSPAYHSKLVLDHPFNKQVALVLATDGGGPPGSFAAALEAHLGSQVAATCMLAELVSLPFLAFLAPHYESLVMLSAQPKLLVDKAILAIDNGGRLWMQLSKHCYEGFGLVGSPIDSTRDRFLVMVDLKDPRVGEEGGKLRGRILDCFARAFPDPCSVVFAFASQALGHQFAASFPGWAHDSPVQTPRLVANTVEDAMVPAFPHDTALGKRTETFDWMELNEWLGLVLHDCASAVLGRKQDPFLSTCVPDETSASRKSISIFKLDRAALVHPKAILEIAQRALDFSQTCGGLLALNVVGEPNAPITWDIHPNRPDGQLGTAHGYSLIISLSARTAVTYQHVSTNLNLKHH